MRALHDMGGRSEFFGPVERGPSGPPFAEPWEGRVFGVLGMVQPLFGFNLDRYRFLMEQLPADVYLASYYRRHLGTVEAQLVDAGLLGPDELDAQLAGRRGDRGRRRPPRIRMAVIGRVLRATTRPRVPPWMARSVLPRYFGTARPTRRRPLFGVGDRVHVRSEQSPGHTRQPGYVTGKAGLIVSHHGASAFSDARAARRRHRPEHVYSVAFDGRELWGDAAEPGTEVRVDLFEAYLEPA